MAIALPASLTSHASQNCSVFVRRANTVPLPPEQKEILMTDQKMQDAKRSDRSVKMIKLLTLPDSERGHIHGSDEGSIRLLEYGDYECPYCGLRVPVLRSGPTDRQGDTAPVGRHVLCLSTTNSKRNYAHADANSK